METWKEKCWLILQCKALEEALLDYFQEQCLGRGGGRGSATCRADPHTHEKNEATHWDHRVHQPGSMSAPPVSTLKGMAPKTQDKCTLRHW